MTDTQLYTCHYHYYEDHFLAGLEIPFGRVHMCASTRRPEVNLVCCSCPRNVVIIIFVPGGCLVNDITKT